MANTYTLIQSVTLTTTASTVTLGSGGTIPQTYTDLLVKVSARLTSSSAIFDFGFNGVTSSQSSIYLNGSGSSATSSTYTLYGRANPNTAYTNTHSNNEIYIPNYSSSNYKAVSIDATNEDNATATYCSLVAGLWSSTSAITSITFTASFDTKSSFYLYGIKNS